MIMPIAPYIGAQVIAVLFVIGTLRWPRIARLLAGVSFIVAGGFNILTALSSPSLYVTGFGPHAFPIYQTFIYGVFARHAASFVVAIALGQLAVGTVMFAHVRWRKLGYVGAIVFWSQLHHWASDQAPSNLIFAVGLALLLFGDVKCSQVPSNTQFAD